MFGITSRPQSGSVAQHGVAWSRKTDALLAIGMDMDDGGY